MDVFSTFKILGSGLAAQRTKMDVVAENLANVTTTRTPEGGPYKRKVVNLSAENTSFKDQMRDAVKEVKVDSIQESTVGMKTVYDPAHPDADKSGQVTMPNVDIMKEMTDMITAARAYEAVATAFDATKNMALTTLNIGK
ncbi:MAG: Flagellar basal-body rod protein FlgC [Syntrophus sp. SKADARSKE-3]|nr:Flagellar basal-body rod protein FlgC [Syntrophus sp. SKADARSKE-3]